MLKDMELDDMEGKARDVDLVSLQEEDIVFSPQQQPPTLGVLVSQDELISTAPPKENKWGPVQAMRKSARSNVGGRTMLEIEIDSKMKKNLEIPKTAGDVALPQDAQELGDPLKGSSSEQIEGLLAGDNENERETTPPGVGVVHLRGTSPPPSRPMPGLEKLAFLSPCTPLEQPTSPSPSPLKKPKFPASLPGAEAAHAIFIV